MTTLQLQQRLAAKLPEKIELKIVSPTSTGSSFELFRWKATLNQIRDTEWDCIVRMVEEGISFEGQEEYMTRLMSQVHSVLCDWQLCHASWQQRATTMVECGII